MAQLGAGFEDAAAQVKPVAAQRFTRTQIAAAAGILFILGAALYWWIRHPAPPPLQRAQIDNYLGTPEPA